jgi:hypothetical protein
MTSRLGHISPHDAPDGEDDSRGVCGGGDSSRPNLEIHEATKVFVQDGWIKKK